MCNHEWSDQPVITPSHGKVLLHVDRNRLRLRGLLLGDVDQQHAVLGLGANIARIGILRQREAAREGAVEALDPNLVLGLFFIFQPAFAADRENALLQLDLDIFLLDTASG
jgi:hypothetical protein